METNKKITGYKGFDKDLKCRDYQYEVGKTFEHEGEVLCCGSGFHFCEAPFDVFKYYPPSDSRYCSVEGSGKIDKGGGGSKISVSKLHISAEIDLRGVIDAGVKFILDKVNWKDNTKNGTGDCSAATNTGDCSVAINTGGCSVATNTGNCSAATNMGNCSAAINTGNWSAATVEGKESIAIVTGKASKAKGKLGCWIVLTERGDWNGETCPIIEVKAFKVDGANIKENTFYQLIGGEAKEVK